MKNLLMNVRACVEYNKSCVREGPQYKCYVCKQWFDKLVYWLDKKFNPDQKYRIIFLCGPQCATEKYERSNR